MKIILNEKEKAVECLKTGEIDKKPSNTICLLAKYYYSLGKDRGQIIDDIDKFMEKSYINYNSVLWNDCLEGIIDNVIKNDLKLVEIESIEITKSECNFIKTLKTEKFQKLTFTYLVYAKILNKINGDNNNWISGKYRTEIFKDADVKETGKDQLKTIYNMCQMDILYMTKNVTNNSVNISKIVGNNEIELIVKDFRELGLLWLEYIGDKRIKKCEVCNKLIKVVNNKSRNKYCKECRKNMDKENNLKRVRKYKKINY